MQELIDRQAAIRIAEEQKRENLAKGYIKDAAIFDFIATFIKNLPTAKPKVRRGRWIETTVRGNQSIICSACSAENQTICPSNFCPNCGVQMDGCADNG